MFLIMNKEVMRITVNSAYEFVYLYEKHIKTKNSFSTPLFYLQTDIDDLAITLKSDDNDFVNRCGVTPKIINKKLFYGADVYVSYDGKDFHKVGEIDNERVVIEPQKPIKAIRLVCKTHGNANRLTVIQPIEVYPHN